LRENGGAQAPALPAGLEIENGPKGRKHRFRPAAMTIRATRILWGNYLVR
jgi:hypothetical protein